MARKFASRAEIFAMSGHLAEHCRSEEVDGVKYAVFTEGWDDERIAKTVSPDLNAHHVKSIRDEVFGKLKPRLKDMDALIEQLSFTQKKLDDLEIKFNKLCDSISVNRVVDVRHLKLERK